MRRKIFDRPIDEHEEAILDQLRAIVAEEPERMTSKKHYRVPGGALMTAIEQISQHATQKVREREDAISRRRRDAARRERQDTQPTITAWLKENLKVGDVVKMKGCRDGHGFRRIIRINPNANYGAIVCEQLGHARYTPKMRREGTLPALDLAAKGITEHMWDKVTHTVEVMSGGQYRTTSVKEQALG